MYIKNHKGKRKASIGEKNL